MKHKLFIDSDTALEFKSLVTLWQYCEKNNIKDVIVLTTYPFGMFRVFNSYLRIDKCTEIFDTENEALKYIGSFI